MPARKKPDRRYLKYRSLKPDSRHTEVSEVLIQHRLDVFKHLSPLAAQVYRNGVALAVMTGGPRENGKPPYQLHSIWVNPGLHIQMVREDEDRPERVIPRTKVSPGKLLAQSLLSIGTIDHLLCVEKQPSVTVTRLGRPALVILPPDAIDRVPAVTIALVRIYRESNCNDKPKEPSIAPAATIDDEIQRLVGCADEARRNL